MNRAVEPPAPATVGFLPATREPRWVVQSRLLRSSVPAQVLHWLLDPASLTDRMRRACTGAFRVRVLVQCWERPLRSEMRALELPTSHRCLVRQVQLLCAGLPWVYARSVIPARTLHGAYRRLARLGERPLGQVLFADRGMRRAGVEVARLQPRDRLFDMATRDLDAEPAEVWGRRSVFSAGSRALLVSEFFLPPLMECAG